MSSNPVRQERDSDPSVCTGTGQLKTENKNQKKKKTPVGVSLQCVYGRVHCHATGKYIRIVNIITMQNGYCYC